jgi:hypothetical protein
MAEVNQFPTWFRRTSADRAPFAVRAAGGIASVCGPSRADHATRGSSARSLGHGLDRQSRPFDGPSPLA